MTSLTFSDPLVGEGVHRAEAVAHGGARERPGQQDLSLRTETPASTPEEADVLSARRLATPGAGA